MKFLYKFGIIEDNSDKQFFYNNTWCVEKYPSYERIIVAPKDNQIKLMLDFLRNFEPPYWCLYILVISRIENEPARYQSPYPLDINEISNFVTKFKNFLETDGRHHIWVGSATTKQLLVYDHHNVIYIYDDIEKSSQYLKKHFSMEPITFPVPHTHMYNADNDKLEKDIMNYWEWQKSPLKEQDTY